MIGFVVDMMLEYCGTVLGLWAMHCASKRIQIRTEEVQSASQFSILVPEGKEIFLVGEISPVKV